jgi:stage II sporulation protein D
MNYYLYKSAIRKENQRCLFLSLILLFILSACMPPPVEQTDEQIPDVRILLGEITGMDTLVFSGTFLLQAEEAVYEFGSNNRIIYIQPIQDGYKIFNENRLLRFRAQDICSFTGENSRATFTYKNTSYNGSFLLRQPIPGRVLLINTINLEEYLKAVVPAEIYTGEKSLFESAKAQAICSRTYSLQRMEERRDKLYDVHMDVRDQVYGSANTKNDIASSAVNETRGIVLSHNGSLATIYFHSSCGGSLEPAENVWSTVNEPYLGGQQDVLGDSFACRFAPNHRWSQTRTLKQMDSVFTSLYQLSALHKTVNDTTRLSLNIKVNNRFKSGRVSELMVSYADTVLHLKNYEIRRFLGWPPGTLLPSTLFRITKNGDSSFAIEGGGAGHGVGLCQWGAMRMSEEGFRYYHILGKYFKGCYLKKLY